MWALRETRVIHCSTDGQHLPRWPASRQDRIHHRRRQRHRPAHGRTVRRTRRQGHAGWAASKRSWMRPRRPSGPRAERRPPAPSMCATIPAMEAALRKNPRQFGDIDILVCGAAGNFPAPVLGMSANALQGRHRYRPARNVQHLPRVLRASPQARREHHQHFGQPRLDPDRLAVPRVRGQSGC